MSSCPGHEPLVPTIEGEKTRSRGNLPSAKGQPKDTHSISQTNQAPRGKHGIGMEHPMAPSDAPSSAAKEKFSRPSQ